MLLPLLRVCSLGVDQHLQLKQIRFQPIRLLDLPFANALQPDLRGFLGGLHLRKNLLDDDVLK